MSSSNSSFLTGLKENTLGNINHKLFVDLENIKFKDLDHYQKKYHNEFNSQGFRSDEFITNHKGKHILFMGCSETQGSNHDLQEAWAYILYNKISKKCKTSGYFNIALIGQSILTEILIMLSYVEKYGYPDEMYFLAPETSRNMIYLEDDVNNFVSVNMNQDYEMFNTETIMNSYLNSLIYLKFLESFCLSNNIKLVWTTWYNDELDLLDKMKFKYFFKLDIPNNENKILQILEKYQDMTKSIKFNLIKEDKHKGLVFHNYWADQFYEKAGYEKKD